MTREEIIEQAKIMIAWLEDNLDIPINWVSINGGTVDVDTYKAIAHSPGRWEKSYTDNFAALTRNFGPSLFENGTFFQCEYRVDTLRTSVCRRVVTGKKIIAATKEIVIPAQSEHEVEVVEWKCDPILYPEHEEQITEEV